MSDSADSTASRYINSTFRPNDRVALLLVNRKNGAVVQRIGSVQKFASEPSQQWLIRKNSEGFDVYIGMNPLKPEARGRRKTDIAEIRHLYLDIDRAADAVLEQINGASDVPSPNHIVSTSPGKVQVVWNVEGYRLGQAENLQRQLARDFGADPAATDAARVLRLPGFVNHKYDPPYSVGFETKHDRTHGPSDFPEIRSVEPQQHRNRYSPAAHTAQPAEITQSERDWADTKRRLWRGESEQSIIDRLADARKHHKWNSRDYAERTVRRAVQALDAEASRRRTGIER